MAFTRRALMAVATVAVAWVACVGAAPTSSTGAVSGDSYVALGDSYAAGEGIGTTTGLPVAGCEQSVQDYPHQVAARLGLHLTDVSCSGAVTANIDGVPQQTGSGTAPLQDAALTASTNLVTVTIGGNDLGFVSIAEYCAADSANGPLALHAQPNCSDEYDPNGEDSLQRKLSTVVTPAISRALADIKLKAPRAKILVIDYPAISTDKANAPNPATYPASCFSSPLQNNSFPFTATDTPYLEQMEAQLGDSVRSAAIAAGDEFVDVFPQSLAHSACAGTITPWMNGITLDPIRLSVVTGSLHPNLAGATAMADTVTAAAEKALTPPSPSAAQATPMILAVKASASIVGITVIVVLAAALVGGCALMIRLRRRRSS
jgi:lysophospholipase L1-like esterase